MPKNVVGRLKTLENEMKNVLSICELHKNEQKASKFIQKRVKPPLRSSSSNASCARHPSGNAADEQAASLTGKLGERPQPKELKPMGSQRKKPSIEKPSSAPPGVLSTINEAENNTKRNHSVQRLPKKSEPMVDADSLEWFDCSPNTCETPELTLRPAEEILIDISQYGNENFGIPKHTTAWYRTCHRKIYDCECLGQRQWETQDPSLENSDKQVSKESFLQLIKSELKENSKIKELARKIELKEIEVMSAIREGRRKPIKCNHRAMQSNPLQNEVKTPHQAPEGNKQLEELHKSEQFDVGKGQDQNSRSNRRPVTAPDKSRASETRSPNRYQMIKRHSHNEDAWEGNLAVKNSEDVPENTPEERRPTERDHYRDKEIIHSVEDIINDPNYIQWIEEAIIEQQESASDTESSAKLSEDLKNLKHNKNLSDATSRKIAEIIERNHEKIEEMRRSRFLALSTVKSMKEKYDALAQMKNNMAEKLEILIKSNRPRNRQKLKRRQNRRSSQAVLPAMNGY